MVKSPDDGEDGEEWNEEEEEASLASSRLVDLLGRILPSRFLILLRVELVLSSPSPPLSSAASSSSISLVSWLSLRLRSSTISYEGGGGARLQSRISRGIAWPCAELVLGCSLWPDGADR